MLLAIGFLDLVVTAVLHSQGLITEQNPLMRPIIERSEWLFAVVKGMTLVVAGVVMARYARTNREFVRRVCLTGSVLYVAIWTIWMIEANVR